MHSQLFTYLPTYYFLNTPCYKIEYIQTSNLKYLDLPSALYKKYGTTLLIVLLVQMVFGQQKPYVNYTTQNGLPQIQVREVFQDSRGYIWAGTKSGLACFNGINFTHYLPNKSIVEIQEDKNNELLIRTTDGLYRYNGNSINKMYSSIQAFSFTLANNAVWVYTVNHLKQFVNDSLTQTFTTNNELPTNGISSFNYDNISNNFYCIDANRTKVYELVNNKFQHLISAPENTYFVFGQFSNGQLFLTKQNAKTNTAFNIKTGREYFTELIKNGKHDSISVEYLPVSKHIYNKLYEYFEIDSATYSASKINLDIIKAPYPAIFDKDLNIWAGSDNGLFHIMNSPFKVFKRSFMNDFWTIIKGADNEFYGAVFKDGLYKLDFEKKQKKEIFAPGNYNGKETDFYYGASKDKSGNLYFPTHFGTVKYNYRNTKKFDTGISLISKYDTISNKIIIGQENGIAFIDANENIDYVIDSSKQFVMSHASCIEFEDENSIWIGTGKSISKYNRHTKQFSNPLEENKPGPKNGVIAITKDFKNNFWLGGKDGLWMQEKGSDEFKRIDNGLIESNIAALISPNPNLLIIGTSREIFALNLKVFYQFGQLEMKIYNYHNGFIAEEVCQNGFLMDGDNLIIPSTTYTSVVNTKQIDFHLDFNDIRISTINDKGIPYYPSNNLIEIEKGINNIDFAFETIGFGLPTTPKFSYKLEGIDKEWKPFTKKTFASYSNLSSGNYVFSVKTNPVSSTSKTLPTLDSVKFKISLPFYREPDLYKYAFFIFLLFSIVFAYFIRSRFKYKIKIAKREQEIKYLEIATLQAQLNPHFIFNLLSSVQNLISQKKPEVAISYLVKFSRLIRAYMESSIKSSKVLAGLSPSNEITVSEEIDLLKMYIDLEAVKHEANKIQYKIEVSNDQILNKTIPPMIIQPLVENAIKHGILPKNESGKLNILFSGENDTLKCVIEDDGIGLLQSKELKNDSIKLYKSRGIELIQKKIKILNDLGYTIHFEYNDVEIGTTVTIYFNG